MKRRINSEVQCFLRSRRYKNGVRLLTSEDKWYCEGSLIYRNDIVLKHHCKTVRL